MLKITPLLMKQYVPGFVLRHGTAVIGTRPFSDKKEKVRGKTPIGKLDQVDPVEVEDPIQDVYAPFPDGKNPTTGEIGGPRGPEPTRYGDWERKGRVTDF